MRFLMEIEVTPDCHTCIYGRESTRTNSDTVYCTKDGMKVIAGEPCDSYFLIQVFNSDTGLLRHVSIKRG